MTGVLIAHNGSYLAIENFFRATKVSTPLVTIEVRRHDERMRRLDAMLDNLRVSFADIAALDAAARGQARAEILQPFEKESAPLRIKPTVARVAGQDIRRFIPRRSM